MSTIVPDLSQILPNFNGAAAQELRVLLVLLSGAVATVFACFGVCPAEACRIRMVADPELNAKGLLKVVQAGPRTGDIRRHLETA